MLGTWLQAVNVGFVCILEGMRVGAGLGVCRAKSKNPMGTLGKGWWSRRGRGTSRGWNGFDNVSPKDAGTFPLCADDRVFQRLKSYCFQRCLKHKTKTGFKTSNPSWEFHKPQIEYSSNISYWFKPSLNEKCSRVIASSQTGGIFGCTQKKT